jgi:hypothetical protein
LCGIVAVNLALHAPFTQHDDARRDTEQLGELARVGQDGGTVRRALADPVVQLRLGAHIDAASWFVEHQYVALGRQPLGEHHLRLISTGE